jgi:hypothetical protein
MFTVDDEGVTDTVEMIFPRLERENSAAVESAPGPLTASLPEPQAASPIRSAQQM